MKFRIVASIIVLLAILIAYILVNGGLSLPSGDSTEPTSEDNEGIHF